MFAVIHVPNFCLQSSLRHEPELRGQPVALVDTEFSKPLIFQVNAGAAAHRVEPGMTATQAMARCSHLTIKSRSPAQESAAAEVLLQTAHAFAANIEATAQGICTMEMTGLRLHDELAKRNWALSILTALAQLHLEAKMGMAFTPALALLAAKGEQPVSLIENADEFVARLPIAALEPSPETSEILRRWGIRTVGELIAPGKDAITERLGAEALELFERVSSQSIRPLKLVQPPEHFSEQIEFEHEIETAAPLLFVLNRFVEQLARRLELIGLVVAEFQLQLALASGAKYERLFKIPSPTGKTEVLFRILQTHLETVRTDSTIVALQLAAKPGRPEAHQFGLFETTLRDPNHFAETLGRLAALCGAENVGTPVLEKTHRPDAFHIKTPDFSRPGPEAKSRDAQGLQLRRFRPAHSAVIEFQGGIPLRIRSGIFSGAVARTRGPFLKSGNWWDDHRWAREEWDIETAGGTLYRIFRSNEGGFVEGIYD